MRNLQPYSVVFFLALVFFAMPVLANAPNWDNTLGLYTAPDFSGEEFISATGSLAEFTLYLCLTGSMAEGPICGFECKLHLPANMYIISTTYPTLEIDFANADNEFSVYFSATDPLPLNDIILLAEINFLWLGQNTEGRIYLEPVPAANSIFIPGEITATYCLDGGSTYNTDILIPSSGATNGPVFGINTGRLFPITPRFIVDVDVISKEDQTPVVGAYVTLLKNVQPTSLVHGTNSEGRATFYEREPADNNWYTVIVNHNDRTGLDFFGNIVGTPRYQSNVSISTAPRQVYGRLRDACNQLELSNMDIEVFYGNDESWTGKTDENGLFAFPYNSVGTQTFEVKIRDSVGSSVDANLYRPQSFPPVEVESGDVDINLGTMDMETNLVVLLHGITGSADDWWYVDWPVHLRNAGFAVYDGINLSGEIYGLFGVGKIEDQAQQVKALIESTGVKSIHVVAHSQGGLVARYLNENLSGSKGMVDKMICLATPHHGSPLASDTIFLLDWLGPAIVLADPNLVTMSVAIWLNDVRYRVPAAEQLKPNSSFMKSLNQRKDGKDVYDWKANCTWYDPNTEKGLKPETSYLTIRGNSNGNSAGEWGLLASRLLISGCGESDGIVPTESAQLHDSGTGNVYNYVHTAHHKLLSSRIFADTTVRDWVIDRLIQDPTSWPAETKNSEPETPDPIIDWSMLGYRELVLPVAGAAVDSIYIDYCDTLQFSWRWFANTPDLILTSPSGATIDSVYAAGDPGTTFTADYEFSVGSYLIEHPESGMWHIAASGQDQVDDQNVMVMAMAAGAVSMTTEVVRVSDALFDDRILTVDLGDAAGEPVLNSTVIVDWTGPSGANGQLALSDDGTVPDVVANDGSYTGQLNIEPQLGFTVLNVNASGSAPGTFNRKAVLTIEEGMVLDLSIANQELIATTPTPQTFCPVELRSSIVNTGSIAASVLVRFVVENTGTVLDTISMAIPAGGFVECASSHLPLSPDTYNYSVEVVPSGDFTEADLTNNIAVTSMVISPDPTGVSDNNQGNLDNELPGGLGNKQAAILSAYPNPFNPRIQLKFALASQGNVHIRIYNLQGRMVRDLFAGSKPRGLFELDWEGTDGNGKRVSAGVYFVHFMSGDVYEVRKVMLIK